MTREQALQVIEEKRSWGDLISGEKDELYEAVDVVIAENTTLQLEVSRLTQCETNMTFLLDCIEKAQFNLPDYTLGTWQERAKGLAPAIATLRTQRDALVEAGEKLDESLEQVNIVPCYKTVDDDKYVQFLWDDVRAFRNALSAAVREVKGKEPR